ncbi:MAG TPA: hypothetical protein VH951_01700 [Dehalococcoidia bacterium]
MTADSDPLARKAHADLVVDRAAQQLNDILHAAVASLNPFPPYPGSFFNYAIEVEAGVLSGPNRGCIVVGKDGELYELIMRMDFSGDDGDPVGMRDEEMRKLELLPHEYIILAHQAIKAVVEYQLEQQEKAGA